MYILCTYCVNVKYHTNAFHSSTVFFITLGDLDSTTIYQTNFSNSNNLDKKKIIASFLENERLEES